MNYSQKLKRYQLRYKLEKIFADSDISSCRFYQSHINALNNKLDNYFTSENYIKKKINEALLFNYSTHNNENLPQELEQYNEERIVDYSKEKDYIIQLLLKNLTFEEFKIICRDLEFFIRDKNIRDILNLIDKNNNLYKILISEEKNNRAINENDKINEIIKEKKIEIIKNHNIKKININEKLRKENENILKDKINKQKKLFAKINFKQKNHTNIINKIIIDSQREINKIELSNISKSRKDLVLSSIQGQDSLNNLSTNLTSIFNKNSTNNIKNLKNERKHFNTSNKGKNKRIILKPLPILKNNNEIKKNNFSFKNLSNFLSKNQEKKTRFKILEQDIPNFINKYKKKIKEVYNEKNENEKLNNLPEI